MEATRVYGIGNSQLTLKFADIVTSDAEVLVSSDDCFLSMSGGVSEAIRTAAGNALALDAAKNIPADLGDVVVTTAGALTARYVFHAVTLGTVSAVEDQDVVRGAVRRCLDLASALRVTSIAFPALGTGAAGFPMEEAAVAMSEVVVERMRQAAQPLDVEIFLYARGKMPSFNYVSFYEEFARRLPAMRSVRRPAPGSRAAGRSDHTLTSLLELESERQLLEAELVARRRGGAADGDLLTRLRMNEGRRLTAAVDEQERRKKPVSVFISYAHADDSLRQELVKHLANLKHAELVREWHDRDLLPGTDWKREIDERLDEAGIILFLLSPDFMASEYCIGVEAERAIARHRAGEARLIPVVLRPVDWHGSLFHQFQALPRDAKPVTLWTDRDAAFVDVVMGVRRAVEQLSGGSATAGGKVRTGRTRA